MCAASRSPRAADLPVLLPPYCRRRNAVVLGARERDAYLAAHASAADHWASLRCLPPAAINQRLLQIMSLLTPLRR